MMPAPDRPAPELPDLPAEKPLTTSRAREILGEIALFLPRFIVLLKRLMTDPRVPRRNKWIAGGVLAFVGFVFLDAA